MNVEGGSVLLLVAIKNVLPGNGKEVVAKAIAAVGVEVEAKVQRERKSRLQAFLVKKNDQIESMRIDPVEQE